MRTDTLLALVAVAVLVALSVAADRRLAGRQRLPMQWGLRGQVNWTLPRRWALTFTPALAALVFALVILLPGESGRTAGVLATGATFVAVHLLHIWLWHRHTG